jgi:Domain of unknown function (DUF3883)
VSRAYDIEMAGPRVLFMNVGWMTAYRGRKGDHIKGGGEYVKEHGFGDEIFNFEPYKGRYYGYGRPANNVIAVERLGAPDGSPFVDRTMVVWVADSRVAGWYKNARVYRERQSPVPGSKRFFRGHECGYYVTAKKQDCKLLDPDARTLAVPRAREVDGGMGRYVWYAEGAQHAEFLEQLFDFIRSGGKSNQNGAMRAGRGGQGWQTDPRRRKRIEEAAVREVMRYYGKDLRYEVTDRQTEHCGWDLEATKNGTVLQLEVKGVAGGEVAVELTANEYRWMKKNRGSYRVCIVTDALLKKPRLSIYGYVAGSKRWEHHEDGTPLRVEPVWVQTARLHA